MGRRRFVGYCAYSDAKDPPATLKDNKAKEGVMGAKVCTVLLIISLLTVPCTFAFTRNEQDCLSASDARMLDTFVGMLPQLHLEKGVERSLASKMSNAAMLIVKERFAAASNLLDALAREIQALEGKKIPSDLAQGILEKIQLLRYCEYPLTSLKFPFENAVDLGRLAPFGIPNWSDTEPHTGIDLILEHGVGSSPIISPVEGTVSHIEVAENPFSDPNGQLLFHLVIFVNNEWSVALTFEPSAIGEPMKTDQLEAIEVKVGDHVEVGSDMGNLLAGDLDYPHVHYMLLHNDHPVCAYDYSSSEAKAAFEDILERTEDWTEVCIESSN
jgi:hypothetical protein